ncbi:MAG: SagB/ThcOx family dehydrogenase [Phycisphaerae bacterium]|nr:SagB/ThcOx family dehydrogenase [Phycisphaerae bacterium]
MDRRTFLKTVPVAAATVLTAAELTAAQTTELKPIELVKPEMEGGKSVLASLKIRQTNRNIKPEPLTPQEMSNLMWAAFGINREQFRGKTGRTAASASNSQEIDLYVALPEGVYVYDAAGHKLTPVVAGDFRSRAGRRGAATAPVNIFFVVDLAKYASAPFQEPGLKDSDIQKSYYFTGVGLIAGNIYLYAASVGLAAWFHNCDKENTHKEFKLRPEQRVLFAQTVGHPA